MSSLLTTGPGQGSLHFGGQLQLGFLDLSASGPFEPLALGEVRRGGQDLGRGEQSRLGLRGGAGLKWLDQWGLCVMILVLLFLA